MHEKLRIGVITKYAEGLYHGKLLYGIHEYVKRQNSNLFVLNTFMINRFYSDIKKVESYYPLAINNIDGWIILTEGASDDYLNIIMKTGKPVVLIGIDKGQNNCTVIKSDNISGAQNAVEHLIHHGHRKIGFLGWMGLRDMKERLEGYKNILSKNGIPYDDNLVYSTESSLPREGKAAVQYWLNNGIDFTAVFAGCDALAGGVIEELKNSGLSVPQDIAVVGYDNNTFAKNCKPGITTINQDIFDLGFTAARALFEEINKESDRGREVFATADIVLRKSCGCSCEAAADDNMEPTKENIKIKNSIIKFLEDTLLKNSDVGTKLLTTNIEGINELLPQIVDDYRWECIGYWDEDQTGKSSLKIDRIYNSSKDSDVINFSCDVENFPPLELIPDINKLSKDDVVWILPISSTNRNWGVMSYISPFNEASAFIKYNISIVIVTLLGIAMDREIAKTELENALETLKQTQNQLIQSEKMAALGGLVAGVAHEINTPIGVSVTAASYMDEKNNEIINLFESGKLKKVDMDKYINTTMESIKILVINLERASNLVKSFKQIAVDQTREEKRTFRLKEYIDEVLLSLHPKIKKTKHKIIVNCMDDIWIHASPGGISQVITNLVVNSLVHAFDDGDEGIMTINIINENDEIIIEYSDNGKGISESDIKKIYEPFFTTKRGSGGTGLGLNIVYNIVTNEYKGKIKCNSTPGNGTAFIIRIPEKEVIKSNGK